MWDLWFYRENVGWWLEESGFDTPADAAGHIEQFKIDHPDYNLPKYQFAITPHGVPLAAPKG